MPKHPDELPRKGRGATLNLEGRFATYEHAREDDGWGSLEEPLPELETIVQPEAARSIVTRNDSPDIQFSQSINPYRGCEHGCIYCLEGETPILYADGRYRPIKEARIGDVIIGTVENGTRRRLVETPIVNRWTTAKPAYRLTVADGTEIVASGDHRFLTARGWRFVSGAERGVLLRPQLELGDYLIGTGALPARKGAHIESAELIADLRVSKIERLGAQAVPLYDITTGTGDFIASGVVSHNCYARPSHAYVDLSPGLDFETRLFYKRDAAARLTETFRKRGYVPSPITLGANTDAYQPIEREHQVARSILEVMRDFRHPVSIITKSALVLRDLDLLAELAANDLVHVMVSITSLKPEIKRTLEPRAAGPAARLRTVRELSQAGVPTGVMVAPIIPAITDYEIEHIVEAAADAGAQRAGYVMLRLPHEVKTLFRAWLDAHYPERAAHVMSLVQGMRGGRDNDPRFGSRMRGEGAYAELIANRFKVACRRHGLPRSGTRPLRTDLFAPPVQKGDQLGLFGA